MFPPADRASLVAYSERFDQLPEATRGVLQRIRLNLCDVSEMDAAVNVDGMSPAEAAKEGLDDNAAQLRAWLKG